MKTLEELKQEMEDAREAEDVAWVDRDAAADVAEAAKGAADAAADAVWDARYAYDAARYAYHKKLKETENEQDT